tara:strand:+ start:1998 stop:2822 length:825 start_codon:yes stop_codon:yes gene_type:complete
MSRLNLEHFINRYFDSVEQNREIQSRTLAYQSLQDSYMNTMITLLQGQANQNTNTNNSRRRASRFTPSVRTTFFDLGNLFSDVVVRPTTQQISAATRELQFSEIAEPSNTRCPITQQDFNPNDTVTQIRHCGHIFHSQQINRWWQRNVHCPVCRHDIRENQDTFRRRSVNEEPSEESLNNNTTQSEENTTQSEENTERSSVNYNNETTMPRIRTVPRRTFSRNSRSSQNNVQQTTDAGINDQEFTSYVNLATQLLNNLSQGDVSGGIDILYTIQ